MNYDDLVREIVNRVNDKISGGSSSGKPRLLIAAQEDCDLCKELRAAPALSEKFQVSASLSKQYLDDIGSCDTVVLFSMGISDLAKIASGAWDDAYTDTAVRAILLGKKVFLVKEAIELYGMLSTAPDVYYDMLLRKLELLQKSGVAILPYAELLPALLGETGAPHWEPSPTSKLVPDGLQPAPRPAADTAQAKTCKPEKEVALDKHIITEKDLTQAKYDGASSVRVGSAILTDLAKEYAQTQGLAVVRG